MKATIATYTICCNEISHIQDIIEHHLSFIDYMYVLDTGSKDGTLEYLQSVSKNNPKIILEQYEQSFEPEYEVDWDRMTNPFPEVLVRNHAINRCEELTKAEWILQLDGDEIWLPEVRSIIEALPATVAFLGTATINPVCSLESLPLERRGGFDLRDPHIRIWRSGCGVSYIRNPTFAHSKTPDIHCVPTTKSMGKRTDRHLFHHSLTRFSDRPVQFHLHWMHGSKMELYFNNKGIFDRKEMIAGQEENEYSRLIPELFWQRRDEWLKGER